MSKQEFKNFVAQYYTDNMKLKGNVGGTIHRLLQRESIVPANIVSFATLAYNISQKLPPLQPTVSNEDNVLFGTKQAGQTLSYRIDSGDSRFDRLVKNVMKMKHEENLDTRVVNWILSSEDFRLESMKPFGLYLGVRFMNMIPDDVPVAEDEPPTWDDDEPHGPSFNPWDEEKNDYDDYDDGDGGYGYGDDDEGEY